MAVIHPPKRQLLELVLAFCAGMILQRALPGVFPWEAFLFSALILFSALYASFRVRLLFKGSFLLALLISACLGMLAGDIASEDLERQNPLQSWFNRPRTLFLARVASSPDFYPNGMRIPLKLEQAWLEDGAHPVEGTVLLSIPEPKAGEWLPGDRALLRLNVKRFHNFNNPGGFDYVRYQLERGIHGRAYLSDPRQILRAGPGTALPLFSILRNWWRTVENFRQNALFWLLDNLEPDSAAFYGAILLDYRHLLSVSFQEDLYRTGATHLLSISGMHLSMIALLAFASARGLVRAIIPSLLNRMTDRHIALWPALFCALLYAGVSGFGSPPIWRALLMLILFFASVCCYRQADALTMLAAAAMIILVWDPNALWQTSFQLSFLCMAGIFCIYPRMRSWRLSNLHEAFSRERWPGRMVRPFEDAFLMSVAVNAMVLPFTIYTFHGFSLAGFAANIVLVPLVGWMVLPLGLASLAVYAVSASAALPILKLAGFSVGICKVVTAWFSSFSWSFFWVGALSLTVPAGFYACLFLALGTWRWSLKGPCMGGVVLVTLAICLLPRGGWTGGKPSLRVDVIDVGQGSSTLVRFPTDETMLVDGGGFNDDAYDIGRHVLAPFLWQEGIRRIDTVVLSHDHPDHRNGLRFILSHFDVGSLWESGLAAQGINRSDLAGIADRRRIPVMQIPQIEGERMIGGCSVRLLHPTASYVESSWDRENLNAVSIVLEIRFGRSRIIIPGDIEAPLDEVLFTGVPAFDGQTLLISPHHGSKQSNPPSLLDNLQPRAVVFSCGPDNIFGFPHSSVLQECERRNIGVMRTDLDGAVTAVSAGMGWELKGYKQLDSFATTTLKGAGRNRAP